MNFKAYDRLIDTRRRRIHAEGFDVEEATLNPQLFPFQRFLVRRALKIGRSALFAECGLGKTPMQLDWARLVCAHIGGNVLILCPLAVAAQTIMEAQKFGIAAKHCRDASEVEPGITVTNYERLHHFSGLDWAGVVLDESSILKSFDGKTKQALCERFSQTPFRLCCSATPAPNDFDELGQHSQFLGWLSSAQMRATWFINDTSKTQAAWRLKGHAESDFWRWVASWASCVAKPSDVGGDDAAFVLPELQMRQHIVEVDYTSERGEDLFRVVSLSATNIHREMRLTCPARVNAAAALVSDSKETWIVWCNTNYEADELRKAIPEAIEVRGSDSSDAKELKLAAFTAGKHRVIITKPSIAGYGLNWQHCHNVVFVGLSYSFEDFYQAIRRSWRFGQTKPVQCHVICAETEGAIVKTIESKIQKHDTMKEQMREAAKAIDGSKKRSETCKTGITNHHGTDWTIYHGDCVRGMSLLDDDSVGFSVFSPPFVDLFTYSDDLQDMGNAGGMEEFMTQFRFLVKELHRTIKPGRLCAVHCLDLMSSKWKDGEIELKNFSGEIIEAFRDEGWLFHCRVTIWKDPVVEMQRTKALGLLHKQLLKDSAMSRTGSPEYLVVFRKAGVNPEPIKHDRSSYPVELWQKDASPVWMDIRQGNVLNGHEARDEKDERHICPLQLDVIERTLRMWSNPGDLVLSPFAGIGSEGYKAILMGRKFVGFELKESYAAEAVKVLNSAIAERSQDLFALKPEPQLVEA